MFSIHTRRRNLTIQWNSDFTNLQGKRKLVREVGGKITVFDWEGKTTFGSSHRKVRKTEGSRNRDPLYNNYRSFCICVLEKLGKEITRLSTRHSFRNAPFRTCFLTYAKPVFSNVSAVWRTFFDKAPFSWRISVDDERPNLRNKAALSNFSSVVWKLPKTVSYCVLASLESRTNWMIFPTVELRVQSGTPLIKSPKSQQNLVVLTGFFT